MAGSQRRMLVALVSALAATSCDRGEGTEEPPSPRSVVAAADDGVSPSTRGAERSAGSAAGDSPAQRDVRAGAEGGGADAEERAAADTPLPAPPAPPAATQGLGNFVSPRTTMVYAEPAWGSDIRGRIDPDAPFAVGVEVEGEGCEESRWAAVELGGYVCLKHAEPSEEEPVILPVLAEGAIVPFIYAKPKQDRKGNLDAEIPRYRSYRQLRQGRPTSDALVANRQYAFVERIWRPSVGHVFVDVEGRAVPGRELKRQTPSDLFGRDMVEEPADEGLVAAWSVSIPALLRDMPSYRRRSREVGSIDYHERLELDPTPISGSGVLWYRIPGAGKDGADAYAEAKQVRFWDPGPELDDIDDDELWLDVDIRQQTLGVRRGQDVLFVTLVSSGTGKHPTPRGIFRIRNKLALGKMENKPDDPESYYVEAVPWVQYFFRRIAFHATYWHRGLGRRRSHGCINLAPRDAAYVFSLTSPEVPKGWTSVHEYADTLGTVVRVRRGDDELVDYRRELPGDEEALAAEEDEESDDDGIEDAGVDDLG